MGDWQGDLLKLLLAVGAGGVIGLEREVRDKPAGFRTMILIAIGSALFTILSIRIAGGRTDPARIAAQIVTGVGFLGAGAILRDRKHVMGLTTAAAIWLVASLGMAAGMGAWRTTLAAVGLVLVVLLVFSKLEQWVDRRRDERTYTVTLAGADDFERVRGAAGSCGVVASRVRFGKHEGVVRVTFHAVGPREAHAALEARLAADADVREFAED